MERLPELGTAIAEVAPGTWSAYAPLLAQNAAAIRSTRKETASYGSHPRQALDVYYPSSQHVSEDAPILVLCYGGGLVRGEKIYPDYADGLVYANLGHFFAEKLGCITVIPDYRLISHGAEFPSGGEDVSLAVEWVRKNLVEPGQSKDLFMMGHSAGGVHIATYLYSPEFRQLRTSTLPGNANKSLVLRGVVMLSVPFDFGKAVPSRSGMLQTYFGDELEKRSPLGLLVTATDEGRADALPGVKTLVLNGTLDPEDEILVTKENFLKVWRTNESGMQGALTVQMMEGQNHISPPLSLGTNRDNEEAWGYEVGKWIDSVRSSTS